MGGEASDNFFSQFESPSISPCLNLSRFYITNMSHFLCSK